MVSWLNRRDRSEAQYRRRVITNVGSHSGSWFVPPSQREGSSQIWLCCLVFSKSFRFTNPAFKSFLVAQSLTLFIASTKNVPDPHAGPRRRFYRVPLYSTASRIRSASQLYVYFSLQSWRTVSFSEFCVHGSSKAAETSIPENKAFYVGDNTI